MTRGTEPETTPTRWCGVKRLIRAVLSTRGKASHEVAGTWLLLLGFVIEFYILQDVIIHQFREDFGDGNAMFLVVVAIAGALVILALLFHQLMIFRNFSLPHRLELRNQQQRVTTLVGTIHSSISQGRPLHSAVGELSGLVAPQVTSHPAWRTRRRAKKVCEVTTYLLFGVLTGEAGYLLTVLRESAARRLADSNPGAVTTGVVGKVQAFFGTGSADWGNTMECLFLLCAALICACVLTWDYLVRFTPPAREEYRSMLARFFWDDWTSFVFWIVLLVIVTPRFRAQFGGVQYVSNYQTTKALGFISWAWGILLLFAVAYALSIGFRVKRGLDSLAKQQSDDDAALITI
jgi:hypothetical protein